MELEKTANLRQDIVKASLIFFRKAGEELIGPQGIVFYRRHGIGKNIVKDRGDGDTQGGGDFCQSFYGDVFSPRSTWPMYVGWSPARSARVSWL